MKYDKSVHYFVASKHSTSYFVSCRKHSTEYQVVIGARIYYVQQQIQCLYFYIFTHYARRCRGTKKLLLVFIKLWAITLKRVHFGETLDFHRWRIKWKYHWSTLRISIDISSKILINSKMWIESMKTKLIRTHLHSTSTLFFEMVIIERDHWAIFIAHGASYFVRSNEHLMLKDRDKSRATERRRHYIVRQFVWLI